MKTAAIIGCGKRGAVQGGKVGWGIAYAHADGYTRAFAGIELAAVDPNPDNLAAFAEAHSIPASRCFASTEAMYAAMTPDCVSICTWPKLHLPLAMEAIRQKVPAIVVEKPIGLDSFEVQTLKDATKRGKSRVAVAHQRRYETPYVRARQVIQSGELGERLVLEGRVGDDWDILSWTTHWFDMASFLLGVEPTWVLAGVDHTGQRRYDHAVENASVVMAQYPGDRQAIFITGPTCLPCGGITVRGEKGMLTIGKMLSVWTTQGYREIDCSAKLPAGPFGALFTDLWSSVGTEHVSDCDLQHTAMGTRIAYAAYESAANSRKVMLSDAVWYPALEVVQHAPVTKGSKAQPLRVALLADAHHEWEGVSMSGRDGLHDALTALGHTVTLLDAAQPLADHALDEADVLVLYHTQKVTSESHRKVVGRWLEAGKPVVVSHCGIGAYADWPQFHAWIGRYWVWGSKEKHGSRHPHVPCTLSVADEAKFEVPWREAWLPCDEMYQALGEAGAVHELVIARDAGGASQVYAWQVKDHPNVVAWLPGHRRDMFALQVVRDGLAASLQLVTGAADR